ncbi:hypothetical protein [Cryptosporangium arvum]|uniref:hypothetical protein n=1 Tax=Cryptosporangium arvum TaxID=80871 RepID=UPI0012EDB7B1|nr:hypothetical protein [Cryptosporangium arvum]
MKAWRWVAALVVVPIVLLGLGVLYLDVGVPVRRGAVALPPDGAPPAEVVTVYFAAVAANDHAAQRALWAPGQLPSLDSDDVAAVTGVRVVRQETYRAGPWDGAALNAYHHAVRLLLNFHVRFWPGLDDPQQPTSTFYLLVRDDDQDPWRIWGAGAYL